MIAYKLNLDGSLSHKAVLNNVDELNTWVWKYKFPSIRIESEYTGLSQDYTDNGTGIYKITNKEVHNV